MSWEVVAENNFTGIETNPKLTVPVQTDVAMKNLLEKQ
jgi:hypothetical protein